MNVPDEEIDWTLTSWEGSRRAVLRDWMKLTLTEKWQAAQEMADLGRATLNQRRRRGLPYIDPDTGEHVPGNIMPERPADSAET